MPSRALAGSYSNTTQATICHTCEAGSYSNTTQSTLCLACQAGSYFKHHPIRTMSCLPGWFLIKHHPSYCLYCFPVRLLLKHGPSHSKPGVSESLLLQRVPGLPVPHLPGRPLQPVLRVGPAPLLPAPHIHTSSNALYFRKGPSSFRALTEASALHLVKHRVQKEAICWDLKSETTCKVRLSVWLFTTNILKIRWLL